ncbi:uncharacterized protein [Onthophagus taurus]|uniref:uncharacterized protein isoform X2 n=1 Tax=Onthophagus taurus TaxID=166361 RepID=UPI000C1FF071|nr:uncharacterized protein LOC111415269 isoform X2 [Onthophagus taurus]
MDDCIGQLCGLCLGALCGMLCVACCESAVDNSRRTRETNPRRNVQFHDMYPEMNQPHRSFHGRRPNQDDDVWNISSRVNQQNQDGTPPNWPTHDHRLSMDFVITPEYNIKDTRPPPPPYSELDLPSYEQATGCRPPRADLTPVHQQSDQNRPGPSS